MRFYQPSSFYQPCYKKAGTLLNKLIITLIFFIIQPQCDELKPDGQSIMEEVDRRDSGWKDSQATLRMLLRNKHKEISKRSLRIKSLEVVGDGDKSLTIFDEPKDVKGTAFLSHTHSLKPDDQWLYLPSIKRVKRIASANKSGPFVGSEFAYEDLTSFELEKYMFKWIKDEIIDNTKYYIIEAIPQYKYSGYTSLLLSIDRNITRPVKIIYFDRKGSRLKTLTQHDFQKYLDTYWRPDRMEMVNHQTGKSTTLLWDNWQFDKGLSETNFNKASLKRSR